MIRLTWSQLIRSKPQRKTPQRSLDEQSWSEPEVSASYE